MVVWIKISLERISKMSSTLTNHSDGNDDEDDDDVDDDDEEDDDDDDDIINHNDDGIYLPCPPPIEVKMLSMVVPSNANPLK